MGGTQDGFNSRAWALACPVKEFVYAVTRKETNFDQWLNLTQSKGNAACATDYLVSCKDVQFPVLVKNRNVFSFANGVYETKSDRFMPYADGGIPAEFIACKYFDLEFPADARSSVKEDWYSIPTPHLQSILDFQAFEPDVCKWMYIMIGRLMYDLNDMDKWQVIVVSPLRRRAHAEHLYRRCAWSEGEHTRTVVWHLESIVSLSVIRMYTGDPHVHG